MLLNKSNKLYFLKPVYKWIRFSFWTSWLFPILLSPLKTNFNLIKNSRRFDRNLEIGTDPLNPVQGFETLSMFDFININYVCNLNRRLPFKANTFDLIYASHVIEHIVWYKVPDVLKELHRIIKPGGSIEVWVPDGYKLAKALVEYEEQGTKSAHLDGYYECMPDDHHMWWSNLRIFAHGDGRGSLLDPNWHRALFTESFLTKVLSDAGFNDLEVLENNEVRGKDHGWINLGVRARK